MNTPQVSVVLGVLNGEATLRQQLLAVLGQITDFEFEVIVVDHGSIDGSVKLVSEIAEFDRRLRLVDGSGLKRGGAAPKNYGVQLARADRIVFCDADDVVRDGWLQAIFDGLTISPIVFALFEYWSLNPRHVCRNRPEFSRDEGGGAFGIWKSIYVELGMFDEEFPGAVDTEFFFRARNRKIQTSRADDAIVSVRLPQTCRSVFDRERKLAFSHPELERRSTKTYKTKKILLASIFGVILAFPNTFSRSGRYRFCAALGALVGRLEGLWDSRHGAKGN